MSKQLWPKKSKKVLLLEATPRWASRGENLLWPHRGDKAQMVPFQLVFNMSAAETEAVGDDEGWEDYDRRFSTAEHTTLLLDIGDRQSNAQGIDIQGFMSKQRKKR
jgi:hypothetical protein